MRWRALVGIDQAAVCQRVVNANLTDTHQPGPISADERSADSLAEQDYRSRTPTTAAMTVWERSKAMELWQMDIVGGVKIAGEDRVGCRRSLAVLHLRVRGCEGDGTTDV